MPYDEQRQPTTRYMTYKMAVVLEGGKTPQKLHKKQQKRATVTAWPATGVRTGVRHTSSSMLNHGL